MQQPANAVVGLNLEFNADSSQVTAHVSLLRNQRYTAAHPRLTLYLVEDDIRAENQIGADGVYMHQHVTRATNQTWGEPVEWTDNRFTYDYIFDLDSRWNREKMQVVAFINNYDGEDHTAISIENAARQSLTAGSTDGVRSVALTTQHTGLSYDLSGRRVDAASHGIRIVRRADGRIGKVVR